jgi:heme exporter protein D
VILDLGPYAGFIIAAYAASLGVVAALIAWIIADHRAQQRTLKDLEARGTMRRSPPREVT